MSQPIEVVDLFYTDFVKRLPNRQLFVDSVYFLLWLFKLIDFFLSRLRLLNRARKMALMEESNRITDFDQIRPSI